MSHPQASIIARQCQVDDIRWPCALSDSLKQQLMSIAQVSQGLSSFQSINPDQALPGPIYFLSGTLYIYLTDQQNKEVMCAVAGKGDWFGALAVAEDYNMPYTLTEQLEPVEVVVFPKQKVNELAAQNHEVYKWLFHIVKVVQPLILQASVASLQNGEIRTVYTLLKIIAHQKSIDGVLPKITISQQRISQISGLSRPRLNEMLKVLEAAGEISIQRGGIHVLDTQAMYRRLRPMVVSYYGNETKGLF